MIIDNSLDRFENYKDRGFEQTLLKLVRVLSFCVALFALFVFILNFYSFPTNSFFYILSKSTSQSFFYLSICASFLFFTSKNKKLVNLAYVFMIFATVIIILAIISFFHLFGINTWMHVTCETPLFGIYNMVVFYIFMLCIIKNKFINIVQIFALINVIIGFGGLLFYLNTSQMFSKSLHYLVFHIFLSSIFMLIPSGNGIFKSLTHESEVSRLSFQLVIFSILGLIVVYVLLELLRPYIIVQFKHVSIFSAIISLSFILILTLLFSKKLVSLNLEREQLEKNAVELREAVGNIQSLSKIAIASVKNNMYTWTSEAFDIFEIEHTNKPINEDLIYIHASDKSKKLLIDSLNETIENGNPGETLNFQLIIDIITSKGTKKYIEVISTILIDENKDIERSSILIEDITEEILIKEDLEISLKNQEILLKEVHHRVKNNLQIILSLLNLELKFNKEDAATLLKKTRNRIFSMATIHEQVYNSSDVAHVHSEDYINLTLKNLFSLYGSKINFHLDVEPCEVHMDKAIPIGLILNELGLNSIKYAFDEGEEGNFYVKFRQEGEFAVISIWDDGKGLPEDFDFEKSSSLGFTIINSLIGQLDGESNILDLPKGFGLEFKFKFDF